MSTKTKQLRQLYASIPEYFSTRRPLTRDDVKAAIRATARAKKRVRVYSSYGFVPNCYRYRCTIQYIEATKNDSSEIWTYRIGWTGAQRSGGRGSLKVIF